MFYDSRKELSDSGLIEPMVFIREGRGDLLNFS